MCLAASLLLTLDPTRAPPSLPPSTRFLAPVMSISCCSTFPSIAAITPSSPYLAKLRPGCLTQITNAFPPYFLYNNRFFFGSFIHLGGAAFLFVSQELNLRIMLNKKIWTNVRKLQHDVYFWFISCGWLSVCLSRIKLLLHEICLL